MAEAICVPGFVGPEPTNTFRYDSYLSQGASGAAWRVIRNSDGAYLCLKITRLDVLTQEERLRTETEVACLESVNHFACIRLYDKRRTDNCLLMAMEYCDAGDLRYQLSPLRDEVARREEERRVMYQKTHGADAVLPMARGGGPVSQCGMEEYRVRFIFIQLVLGLHYIHVHKKILHRDLKPANVLLTTNGLVKIGDFGLSNVYDTISGDVGRTICGTPAYVAPELWLRQHYGRAADMWSLGCVIYECMTGNPPFSGGRLETLQRNVLTVEPAPITGPYSSLLKEAVMSLLIKNPAERPDTIALLRYPYLQNILSELAGVLAASEIPPALLEKVQSDIRQQFEQVPKDRVDNTITFEGEVEKFKPPQELQRRYMTLAKGVLTIHKNKRAAMVWASNGGGRVEDDEAEANSQSTNSARSNGSGSTGSGGQGSPTGDLTSGVSGRSSIHVSQIENIKCIEDGYLALRLTDRNFMYFRTQQASMWERMLCLAKGSNLSSVRSDRSASTNGGAPPLIQNGITPTR